MPVIQGLTRLAIRQAVGQNLGAYKLVTAIAGGSTTTFLTDDLFGGNDDYNGRWLHGPTLNPTDTYRVVDSSVASYVTTLTFHPAATSIVADNTAELWDMRYDPTRIHEHINQALTEVTGLAYDPEESLALHGDGRQARFDIPTEFAILNGVDYRKAVESKIIHQATTEWDEAAAPTNITRVLDKKDYKLAPASNKFSVAAAFTTGLASSKAISSLDLSGYDYVEFWIKSTIATLATTLDLLLDDTAVCASALETLSIPALTADTWTFVRVALANPELDTAIISVGLIIAMDTFAAVDGVIWINDVRAVKDDTAVWVPLNNSSWRVDQLNRDLILTQSGRLASGYRLLRLRGGDKPAMLTTDAGVCEVDDQFVIARATELALLAASGGPNTDPDALRSLAGYWGQKAEMAKRNFPFIVDGRAVG